MKITKMHLLPRTLTVVVLFVYLTFGGMDLATAQYYNTGLNLNREIRMCGPLLTNTLELVCQGRFNTMIKKSQSNPQRSQEWTASDRDNYSLFPFRSKRNALGFNGEPTFRRRARNVADECCFLKSCTLAEMSNYCERN